MDIEFRGDSAMGYYEYPDVGEYFDLVGSRAEDGTIVLNETNSAGQNSGMFTGAIDDMGNFVGKWSKPDGKKAMAFNLVSTVLQEGQIVLEKRELDELNDSLNYQIAGSFPRLVRYKDANVQTEFNKKVSRLIQNQKEQFRPKETQGERLQMAMDYEKVGQDSNFFSVLISSTVTSEEGEIQNFWAFNWYTERNESVDIEEALGIAGHNVDEIMDQLIVKINETLPEDCKWNEQYLPVNAYSSEGIEFRFGSGAGNCEKEKIKIPWSEVGIEGSSLGF